MCRESKRKTEAAVSMRDGERVFGSSARSTVSFKLKLIRYYENTFSQSLILLFSNNIVSVLLLAHKQACMYFMFF